MIAWYPGADVTDATPQAVDFLRQSAGECMTSAKAGAIWNSRGRHWHPKDLRIPLQMPRQYKKFGNQWTGATGGKLKAERLPNAAVTKDERIAVDVYAARWRVTLSTAVRIALAASGMTDVPPDLVCICPGPPSPVRMLCPACGLVRAPRK